MKEVPVMPNVPENEKLTWSQLCVKVREFNDKYDIRYVSKNKPTMICRVVFNPTKSEWRKYDSKYEEGVGFVDDLTKPITYTPAGCTYEFKNHDKYWDSSCIGNSLYAYSLDPNESDSMGIKLNEYINDWVIDYCYIYKIVGETNGN